MQCSKTVCGGGWWHPPCEIKTPTKCPTHFPILLLAPTSPQVTPEPHPPAPSPQPGWAAHNPRFQTEVLVTGFYHCRPVPTRRINHPYQMLRVAENVLVQNSASVSLPRTQQVIFMDCLQVARIWHSKEVCNFYMLSSSLFIFCKPPKGQPSSACLRNFRLKERSST